jgi:hypothetical protein
LAQTAPGEVIIAAAKCLQAGHSKRRAAGGVFGVLGAVAAGQSGRQTIVGGYPLPLNLAVGRLRRSAGSGTPEHPGR